MVLRILEFADRIDNCISYRQEGPQLAGLGCMDSALAGMPTLASQTQEVGPRAEKKSRCGGPATSARKAEKQGMVLKNQLPTTSASLSKILLGTGYASFMR